jgi:hypothetical protein
MSDTTNRRFVKIPLLRGFCMVVEKFEQERSSFWFPEVYFFGKSGQLFVEITEEYVGSLYEELINLDNKNHVYSHLPGVLCFVSKRPNTLVIGIGRTLHIMYSGQTATNKSEIAIMNEHATEIVKAMKELG